MADIIKQLPDAIANKIAAGEVVQRPSSVVKELLENAIDAGARNITLVVKEAGKSLTQVMDDGKGMSISDARFSFERHSTSKILVAEDLFTIKTMGFRGEALASISAVSRVELITREKGSDLGTKVLVEGSEFKGQETETSEIGTSIQVKNLFYNIPARRKFLKSDPVELKHVLEEFNRIALSYPDIGLSFFNSDLQIHHLKGETLFKRIVHLLGKNYQNSLLPCQEETSYLSISGFIGVPEIAKKTRGDQYFFVNGRYIRNNYFQHAIKTAYQGLIPEDHTPFFVLNIQIDPDHVDVNVHPSKNEVKFDDERSIYGLVAATVKKALGSHHVSPSIDFTKKVSIEDLGGSERSFSSSFQFGTRSEGIENKQSGDLNSSKLQQEHFDIDQIQQDFNSRDERFSNKISWDEIEGTQQNFEQNSPDQKRRDKERSVMQIAKAYLLTPVVSGLMVIEQSRAHERILFEKFTHRYSSNKSSCQQCLFPEKINVGKADIHLLLGMEKEIKGLGFDFEYFGNDSVVINGVPEGGLAENEKELFEGMLELYKNNAKNLKISKEENLIRALSKKSAIAHGRLLEKMEIENLIDELFACKIPQFTPDGLPTFVKMDYNYFFSTFSNKS
jgi:DNA mismatch repair protein MutL